MLLALKLTPERLAEEVRLAAAAKLFEPGRLSSGAAAMLAGVPLPVFLGKLADYDVSLPQMSEAEIREDARRA